MLTSEIARNIVHETMKTLGRNINIMDENGIILGSGDPQRIDTFHEAAVKVVESGKPIVVSEQDAGKWKGTKPGVNLPIKFQGNVIGVVGISGKPQQVKEFGALVVMMTELMIQQIYLMNQVEWKHRTREFLLEEILSDHPPYQQIEQKRQLLKIELSAPFAMHVCTLRGAKTSFVRRTVYEKVEAFLKGNKNVYGYVDTETFVILSAEADQSGNERPDIRMRRGLKNAFSDFYKAVQIGFGRPVPKLRAVNESFRDIRMAMSLANGDDVDADQYEPQFLLSRTEEVKRGTYQQKVLNSLPGDLLETMDALFSNDLNLSRTAKQLFIHRNTLIYRINKIQEMTGYDPRRFRDAAALQMAAWCRELDKLHENH